MAIFGMVIFECRVVSVVRPQTTVSVVRPPNDPKLGVFGSVARGEIRDDSDVDIYVTVKEPDLLMCGRIS